MFDTGKKHEDNVQMMQAAVDIRKAKCTLNNFKEKSTLGTIKYRCNVLH